MSVYPIVAIQDPGGSDVYKLVDEDFRDGTAISDASITNGSSTSVVVSSCQKYGKLAIVSGVISITGVIGPSDAVFSLPWKTRKRIDFQVCISTGSGTQITNTIKTFSLLAGEKDVKIAYGGGISMTGSNIWFTLAYITE